MDSWSITIWMIISSLLWITQGGYSSSRFDFTTKAYDDENVIDVVAEGAVGDGKTDDSQAFLKAWKKLCEATTDDPTLVIPSEKTFLLNPVAFKGPYSAPNPNIQVLGNIVAPSDVSAWNASHKISGYWILFSHVDGLKISGKGQIDGKGSIWWKERCSSEFSDGCTRPTALKFEGCKGLQLSGLTHVNSQRNHISIDDCNNVIISHIHIIAPKESPNTDGIDISHSSNIHIKDSFIGTGDDCVAINSGCSFINITNVNCGPGHGISVGSLGAQGEKASVEEIHVHDCTLNQTMYGTRIKTWQGGHGYARAISFDHITLINVHRPIIIDQYYCNGKHGCQNQTSAVKISDVSYTSIHGTSANDVAITLSCSETVPCENIVMNKINIESSKGSQKVRSYCFDAEGKSSDTSPAVPCLS